MKSTTLLYRLALPCLISAVNLPVFPALAQQRSMTAQTAAPATGLSYADIVDLADNAPLVAHVRIRNIIVLKPEQAKIVPAGYKRLFLEGDVTGLIRGEAGITPLVSWLYDAPIDTRGKLPKLKKAQVILFARPGSRPGQIQLVARDAQIPATPVEIDRVKGIESALLARDTPPRILGLGDAFHVAGTVAGEGETQIFLRTEKGDPVSLSILRRPGEPPRWAVALGEIVDEAARAPAPGSLLWYRLACALPPALPSRAVRTLSVQDAEAARADYKVVIDALGPCGRTRTPA
jgi:hypothetical protein